MRPRMTSGAVRLEPYGAPRGAVRILSVRNWKGGGGGMDRGGMDRGGEIIKGGLYK